MQRHRIRALAVADAWYRALRSLTHVIASHFDGQRRVPDDLRSLSLSNILFSSGYTEHTMPTPSDDLKASLERHNATFETLLKLIPAKYYLVQEATEEEVTWFHVY